MPGMDGYEICRRIKSQHKDTAVIFITGADGEAEEATGLGLGAIDYITKPFAPAIVRARVRNHLALVRANEELRTANEALARLAVTDPLTGVANRRRFMEVGAQELMRAQRAGNGLVCVLMLDIDHFKAINDTHGHPAGDAVIQAIAAACVQAVRAIDTVGRLGGEEFGILLPQTECTGAVEVAERLREKIESTVVSTEEGALRVTVSIGVAQGTAKTRAFESLLSAADKALYRAKKAGRNRVANTIWGAPEEVST
jgi:diguanylate cyclase (GGDEF)-like protein